LLFWLDPCSRNPCGQGICEVIPKLLYGYLCRCAGDTISLTNCNSTQNVCAANPCINGICIEGLTSFICNCLPGWSGRFCNGIIRWFLNIKKNNNFFLWIEKIDSPCSNNPCGTGECFSINKPSLPYICLCQNRRFSISCQSNNIFFFFYSVWITFYLRYNTFIYNTSNGCNYNRFNSYMQSIESWKLYEWWSMSSDNKWLSMSLYFRFYWTFLWE
jgi:hypothetical protein